MAETRSILGAAALALMLWLQPAVAAEAGRSVPVGLLEALENHRRLIAAGGWPVVTGSDEVKLDQADPREAALRDRLRAEGDLDAAPRVETLKSLRAGIRRFQTRHGLDPDGRVGPLTLRELAVTADARLAQIEINLDRWQRLPPRPAGGPHVIVNVAAATLTLHRDGAPPLAFRVIVGDEAHPTPVFAARIAAITLNPPWSIPASIANREILPKARRNPRYFADQDIVILDRPADPFGLTVDWHAIPDRGLPFRLQQRPGPRNALGRVKFEMPNRFDVYLHDTPTKQLFDRSRRALSHGCIRVARPLELAAALLGDGHWTVRSLEDMIMRSETRRISIVPPVPIHLVYLTAFVDAAGRLNFRHDIYGLDARREPAPGPARVSRDVHGPAPGGCREPKRLPAIQGSDDDPYLDPVPALG